MGKTLKTEGWTLLDFEGLPIAEGLPNKGNAVFEMLTDDGYDYEFRPEKGGGFRLWLLSKSRHAAGSHRFIESVFVSMKVDEYEAIAEILDEVASMAGQWRAGGGYRILTDAERAEELAEDDEEAAAA